MLTLHRIVKQKKGRNEYIPLHSHTYFHCIYGLSGKAAIQIREEYIQAGKGMFLCLCPGTPHAIFGIDNFQSFDIKFSCSDSLTQMLAALPASSVLNRFEDAILKDIFHEAIRGDCFAEEIINAQMTGLIYRLLRKEHNSLQAGENLLSSAAAVEDKAACFRLRPAIQYIENHLDEEISVAGLASLCGYNSSYFSTVFRNTCGLSPRNYINSQKISKAKDLLLTTDYSITQISGLLGLQLHTFSRMFKNAVGISPLQYYSRANSDIGINVSKSSPYAIESAFEIPLKQFPEV
ncbi:AraC family transcriptional regulator [Lacrimispora sp.]|uniref:AraC family transcriptional regulator n=1 Tax=Lacrimispora sp. TaxID=2719234 RepID=UPI003995E3FF